MRGVLGPLLRVVLYGAGLLVLGDVVLHRWAYPDQALEVFGEYGRLEWIQVGLLVLGLGICVLTAIQRPASRPLSVLLAGFLVAVLVREHNNYFKDNDIPGSWQLPVVVVLALTAGVAWRWRSSFAAALRRLVGLPAFGWLAAAVLLAAFAQLLDEQSLWDFVLRGREVPYAARRVGEETVEVAAFYLLLVGLIEYRIGLAPSDARTR